MSKVVENVKRSQFSHWVRNNHLVPAMETLTIANVIVLLGLFIYNIIDPGEIFSNASAGADSGVISIGFIWLEIIRESVGVGLLLFGWTIAGIYAKQQYGKDAPGILLRASTFPVLFIFITEGLILMSLLAVESLAYAILVVLYYLILGLIISGFFAFGGLIVALFVSFKSSYEITYSIEPDYLVLPVVPEGEKVKHCPFRSKKPGCSYLGYVAPDKSLICDYESAYRRCRVYSHIYEKMEEKNYD